FAIGGEAAGGLGRRERLFAHASEEEMLRGDVASGGRGEDADAAGFVVRERERRAGRDVAKRFEEGVAGQFSRRPAEPSIEVLEGGAVDLDGLPRGLVGVDGFGGPRSE